MFAVSEFVPAELGTCFSWLIFIKTAIDFNDLVNRHTDSALSISLSLFALVLLFFLLSVYTTTSVSSYSHISQPALIAMIAVAPATDVDRLFKCSEDCQDSCFYLRLRETKRRQ